DDIVEKYNNYKDSTNTLNFNINANDQLKSYDEKIITDFEFLMKAVASLRDSISADKVSEYLQKMVVVNNNKGDYTSLPFQFSGEQTRLQINITPRDPAYKLQSYSTQIVFPTFPLKYNVTGISYYYSGLYDDAYTTLKPNDTTYQYSLIPSRNYEPGIAALLHSGSKFKGNCIGYHITFGIGANISEKVRPRLMVGFGASFGKKHMISIDGGLIVGNVNRLNAGVDFNKIYFEKQRPDPIISQEVSYKLFASIGYLFKF
ncbi:MAG: hypothetical protein EBX50_06380, partial [Chitinophagia bacterium]|nr:hypothetical protein [Chitinophagia bacterium]